jgi:hypothetical protein
MSPTLKRGSVFVILRNMIVRVLDKTPPPNPPNLGETTPLRGAFEMRKGRGCRQYESSAQLGRKRYRRAGRERRCG